MHLRSITLRDWKAYNVAKFDFPSPTSRKNIVLIGAQNGYGKTSLFEAMVLGLFGKDGLPLIARAAFADAAAERLQVSYRSFLEKAINQNAIANGRTSCSVTLVFGMDDDEDVEIKRIWSFSDSGAFRPNDEEIQIFEGSRRKPKDRAATPVRIGLSGFEIISLKRFYHTTWPLSFSLMESRSARLPNGR